MAPELAVDNDVVLKGLSYDLTDTFWPDYSTVGVLGAARYVVATHLGRAELSADPATRQARLEQLLSGVVILEPTESEVLLAADIEAAALERGLALDGGESLLCAMVALGVPERIQTGDKRAIRDLEQLLPEVRDLNALTGNVSCLEQVVRACCSTAAEFDAVTDAIRTEPRVDKTLSICFSAFGPCRPTPEVAFGALESYIEQLRRDAPTILAA